MRKFSPVTLRDDSFATLAKLAAIATLAAFIAGAATAIMAEEASGQPSIVQIEEDWELVVGEPDPDNSAPQVTVVFSPLGDTDTLYGALDINHRSQPEFSRGGLQLQVWQDDEPLATVATESHAQLNKQNETVRWTQRLTLNNGQLTFAVLNGESDTWGAFGNSGNLSLSLGSSLENLNAYHPDVSVNNSGIGFAANRVKSLKLLRVRAVTSVGQTAEDTTERTVYVRD